MAAARPNVLVTLHHAKALPVLGAPNADCAVITSAQEMRVFDKFERGNGSCHTNKTNKKIKKKIDVSSNCNPKKRDWAINKKENKIKNVPYLRVES